MKIQVLQENLIKALTKTGRVIQSKTQLPVLQNVLLKTEEGRLRVVSSNLETTESVWIGVKVEKEGSLCVPSKLFTEFVSSLPKETVHLEEKEGKVHVVCGSYKATIPGVAGSEFPPLPDSEEESSVKIKKESFTRALESVLFSAAADEGRPLLTGVKMRKKGGKTVIAATDGYRLSVNLLSVDLGIEDGIVVPARALEEIIKISSEEKDEEDLEISRTKDGQLTCVCGDTEITTRLLDGEYPDYEKIIPTKHTTRVTVEKDMLFQAVKSAAIFARDSANIVRFVVKKSSLTVSSNTPQVGKNSVDVDVKSEGDGGEMAFNSRFLLEFLQHITFDVVVFEMTGSLNPGVFKGEKDKTYLHIIMPVRVQS